MKTHAEKQDDSSHRAAADRVVQKESGDEYAADQHPAVTASESLQETADNSEQTKQAKAYQSMTGNEPRAAKPTPGQTLQRQAYAPVVQRISDEDAGAYIGYTLGGDLPTLYFEKGHLTQKHKEPENEGWHPNKGSRHFIRNVDPGVHKWYGDNRSALKRSQKNVFGGRVEGGMYPEKKDEKGGNGLMIEGDVHVTGEGDEKKETFYLHPSRGRFIAIGDPAFDKQYDANYAKEKVNAAALAQNER